MFLVLGTRSALLIDTGLGEKGLDAVAASITDLPVTVVNTHGHEDHAGGNRFFDTICAHPGDMDTVARFSPGKKITEVKEGFSFDLGGRSLSVIETPGHTRGSICLLDAANRIIFTGDNNNGHVWLFLYESLPVETYLASLERLMARSGEFDVIYPGHGSPCGLERLTAIAASARAILKGGAATRPYQNYANAVAYGPEDALVAFDPRKLRRP
jgi:glyoxylase-like metal-dependent hydrolase (beta-lactamase superfamily II)